MIKRPRFYAVTVLALAGLAAAGCSSSSSSSTASSGASTSSPSASSAVNLSAVTLNVGDQKGTGAEAVLTAAGLLNTLPFHVTWSDFTSGPPMLEAMASGSVDIGGVGDAPPVFAASGGEQVEIVGARQTNGDQDAVVVPKNSPITSIQQLKGKKIAYGSGSSANYNLLRAVAWGKAAGLPASIMAVAAKLDATTPAPITSATVSSEQNLVNQFFAAGLIPTKVDISGYITSEFNDTVSGSP
ncbi:MAG: PhnD/SsuA/transferrin family substrate-binding protein [Trebonia sp.]